MENDRSKFRDSNIDMFKFIDLNAYIRKEKEA